MPTFPAVPALPVDGIDLNFSAIGASESSVTLSGSVGLGTVPFTFTDATSDADAFFNAGGALGAKYTADTITVSRGPSPIAGESLTFGAYSVAMDVLVGDASGALVQPTAAIPITFHARILTLNGLTDAFYTVNSSTAGFELITLPTAWHAGLLSLSWSVSSSLAFTETQDLVVVPNHRPIATDLSFATPATAVGTFQLSATDPDGQPVQYEVAPGTSLPAGVTLTAGGSLTVTPLASDLNLAPGQTRVITFQYEATDAAQLSGPAQVVSYTIPGTPPTGGGGPPPIGVGSAGSGFGLGDGYNYALIAFQPEEFNTEKASPINGNVGIGQLGFDKGHVNDDSFDLDQDVIKGNLVFTGAQPANLDGTVTGTVSANNAALAALIKSLTTLSTTLGAETGTVVDLSKLAGATLRASAGTLDAAGNRVFTITHWSDLLTISGSANDHVVLNIDPHAKFDVGNLTLTGGITSNNVLVNIAHGNDVRSFGDNAEDGAAWWPNKSADGWEATKKAGAVFNGTLLAPFSSVDIHDVTINGHVYGGNDDWEWSDGATLNGAASPAGGTGGTPPQTITETIALNPAPSTISITITGPPLTATLLGNSTQQTLTGGAGAQWIIGGSNGDVLIAGSGSDTIIGGSNGAFIQGGPGASLLIGSSGGVTIDAGSGNETMVGGGYGFATGVTVPGLSKLPASPGITWNAATTGPTGVLPATGDVFQFETLVVNGQNVFFGNTVIQSFDPVHDVIQISPLVYAQASDVTVAQVGANTVISVSHVDFDSTNAVTTITLVGISASAINATNLTAG